jgi:hypothetical protein
MQLSHIITSSAVPHPEQKELNVTIWASKDICKASTPSSSTNNESAWLGHANASTSGLIIMLVAWCGGR